MLEPRLRGGRLLAGPAEVSEAAVHRGRRRSCRRRTASRTRSRKVRSGHLPSSVNKVRGSHGGSPGEARRVRELDACPLREQGVWVPLPPHSAFLPGLPPSQRLWGSWCSAQRPPGAGRPPGFRWNGWRPRTAAGCSSENSYLRWGVPGSHTWSS